MRKVVVEDWSHFNLAVQRRAQMALEAMRPPPPPPQPVPLVVPPPPAPKPVAPPPPQPPRKQAAPIIHAPADQLARSRIDHFSLGLREDFKVRAIIGAVAAVGMIVLFIAAANSGRGNLAPSYPTPPMTPPTVPGGQAGVRRITNYTTFNRVDWRDGVVVTGWNFRHNGDATPVDEYCYFEGRERGGTQYTFNIELRPVLGRQPIPDGLRETWSQADWNEAAGHCQWHPSSRPVATASPYPPARPADPAGAPQRTAPAAAAGWPHPPALLSPAPAPRPVPATAPAVRPAPAPVEAPFQAPVAPPAAAPAPENVERADPLRQDDSNWSTPQRERVDPSSPPVRATSAPPPIPSTPQGLPPGVSRPLPATPPPQPAPARTLRDFGISG
ncbi:MAG TPA: hypothetical protein VGM87_15175 [Roseomonas sp.]